MDKVTGKPRGFGFVVFEHIDMLEAVLRDYDRHVIDGKWVEVKRATGRDVDDAPTAASTSGGHHQQAPAQQALRPAEGSGSLPPGGGMFAGLSAVAPPSSLSA